jgi:hypothetical protein
LKTYLTLVLNTFLSRSLWSIATGLGEILRPMSCAPLAPATKNE